MGLDDAHPPRRELRLEHERCGADRGRITGDENAKIWVIMVSDFQCPFCKQWHDASFEPVLRDYAQKGKIRLAFINFPLNIHPNAIPAAEAAMCASVQDKFWPMHEALFAAQSQWAPLPDPAAKLESVAASIPGMDMPAWKNNRRGVNRGGMGHPASRPAPPCRAGRDPAAGPCRAATVRPGG